MTLLKREIPAPPFATVGTESSFMIIKPGRTTAVTVKPIPDGYRSVTPYLSINGAAEAITFYK